MTITHVLFGLTMRQGSFDILKFPMFSPIQHLQVLNTVVEFVTIDMMYLLFPCQQATNMILHNQTVFQNITVNVCIWMIRYVQFSIPATNIDPSIPHRMIRSSGVNSITGFLPSSVVFHKQEDRSGRFFLFLCMRLSTWL